MLANPKTVVNDRYAKKEVKEQVIRADQLIETIKRMNKASKESASSLKDLKEMGERYLSMHIEKPITYIEKFKQEELEDQPAAEQPALIEPAKPELPEKPLSEVRQAACHAGGQTRCACRRKNSGAAQDFLNVIL